MKALVKTATGIGNLGHSHTLKISRQRCLGNGHPLLSQQLLQLLLSLDAVRGY